MGLDGNLDGNLDKKLVKNLDENLYENLHLFSFFKANPCPIRKGVAT